MTATETEPEDFGEEPAPGDEPKAHFDPEKEREEMRRNFTNWLLCILAGTLIAAFLMMAIIATRGDKEAFEREADLLMKMMTLVFGPLVALIGSAVGFYFGSNSTALSGPAKANKLTKTHR